jgi:hypothetical protein
MTAPARAKPSSAQTDKLPREERMRLRAYELYVQRGNESGSEFDDWLQAEEESRPKKNRNAGKRVGSSDLAAHPPLVASNTACTAPAGLVLK